MRTVLLAAALLALPVAGCLAPAALETADLPGDAAADALPKVFSGVLHEWADVPAEGGITVHLDLWRPDPATFAGAAAEADMKVPVVFDMGPYFGEAKENPDRRVAHYVHDWAIEQLVPRGYAFAAVELSGTAGSTGCWDFMGPQEVASTAAAVEFLGTQEWSNGKVGMIGKSYDAMTQIMAASERPEHLATIVPVAPLTHAYAGIYMNGVPYLGWYPATAASYQFLIPLGEPPLATPERQEAYAKRLAAQPGCAADNMVGAHASVGDYDDYYKARDFRESAKEVDIPVFFQQGFLDRNVKADNAFPYVNDLAGPKMVWLGQWYHDYANATWAGRDDMYLQLHRWFDHWLKGVENGIEADLGIHVQDSEGRWRREAAWPPADAVPTTFALDAGSFFDDGSPAKSAPGRLPLPDAGEALVWSSGPLASTLHVAGPAEFALNVSSSGPKGQVVAMLYDCAADDCALVARGALDLTNRNGLEKGEPLTPGAVYPAWFALQPNDHVFAAGREVVVVLEGSDGDWFTPEGAGHTVTVVDGTLTLPTIERDAFYLVACGDRIAEKPCYQPGLKDRYLPG